ncbi:MAG: methyltransferase domain-containing protein [Gemmatimonadales bacterium]|nr:MAG: methyltransferase domain-containing protein [Gemmatimonadales bacterium]
MIRIDETRTAIQDYYGRVLGSSQDLRTGACCTPEQVPARFRPLLARIHPEVSERFYGCGVPIPPALEAMTVLDLGCGTGRDCYLLSQLVGETGRVIGVDMTEEQIECARSHRDWHARQFGHRRSNVEFHRGFIEELAPLGIEAESIDVVVSNCVFNLSPDKARLFAEIFRVLKPGGELYFSDVFADRRIPAELRSDPVLLGECLAGALYGEDFRRLLDGCGCSDVRELSNSPVEILDPEIEARIGMVRFTSRTLRAFKVEFEDRCEDFGQVATYLGSIEGAPHAFVLDDHHRFEAGRPERVCGNTAGMLGATRYAPHFRIDGDRSTHFGLFDCGPGGGDERAVTGTPAGCC